MDHPKSYTNRTMKIQLLIAQMRMMESPLCGCGQKQTITCIAEECTLTKFTRDIEEIHTVREKAIDWMKISVDFIDWMKRSIKQ